MRRADSLFWIVFVVALFLASSSSYGEETIKVGIVNAYSGAPSRLPEDVLDGFSLAVEKINAQGGVLGRKIAVATATGKGKEGLEAAQSLVRGGRAHAIVATMDAQNAIGIADFAAQNKIPLFIAFSERPLEGGPGKNRYVFNIGETPSMAGAAAAVMFHEKPYEKFWIAGDDDEYGHSLADGFWGMLHKLEPTFQLLGETWWKPAETDYGPVIAQIMAAKPQCVVVATSPSHIARFQAAAKAGGLSGKIPFYQHWASEHSLLAEQGVNAEAGVYGTTSYLFYTPSTPANKAFTDEFGAASHRHPGSGAFYGFAAGRIIAEGYAKAGAVDAEKLVFSVEGMRVNTPVGRLLVRPCDHQLALPVFLTLTGKVPAYSDFLTTVSLQSLGASYYMDACKAAPK